jgi:hypothetical protein
MCWPGPHQQNCEERGRKGRGGGGGHHSGHHGDGVSSSSVPVAPSGAGNSGFYRSSDKLQCAIYYAIDGDQVRGLNMNVDDIVNIWLLYLTLTHSSQEKVGKYTVIRS